MKCFTATISLFVMSLTTVAQTNPTILFATDSTTYWLLSGTMSWNAAQVEAEVLGGHLATLNSPAENVAVFEAFHAVEGIQSEDGYFIGLFQNTNANSYSEPAGGWEWIAQGTPEYYNWRSNEPNSGGNNGVENCANVFGESQGVGLWNDCSCSIAYLYAIAEVPTESVLFGCTDATACNFDADATIDDGTCEFSGCTDDQACNFSPEAVCDDGSCDYSCCPGPGCCSVGHYWDWEIGKCFDINPGDINLDGCVQLNDLLDLLSAYGDCGSEESAWQCGDPLEYQGYDYETVQIGEQCWFAENLRAENYRNGDVIPVVADDATWNESTMGTKRPFENDLSNVSSMGYLYSWYAGNDDRELCPTGWHVPSKTELAQIEMALGMPESEALSEGWYGSDLNVSERMRSTSWGGSDELGFNVIRAPWHSGGINATAFLTSTLWDSNNGLNSTTQCWTLVVTSDQLSNYHADSALPGIYSVRCIKDAE